MSASFALYFHNRDKLAVELARDEGLICSSLYLTSLHLKFTQVYLEAVSGATFKTGPCFVGQHLKKKQKKTKKSSAVFGYKGLMRGPSIYLVCIFCVYCIVALRKTQAVLGGC